MGNIVDIVVVLVFLATVLICAKIGFIKLLSPFRKITALAFAWGLKELVFVKNIVGVLIGADRIRSFISGKLNVSLSDKLSGMSLEEADKIEQGVEDALGIAGSFFNGVKEYCASLYEKYFGTFGESNLTLTLSEKIEGFISEATDFVSNAAVSLIVTVVAFILLYVVFSLTFKLLVKALDSVFSDGALGTVNRILGGAVGILYGLLIAWIVSMLIGLFGGEEALKQGFMGISAWIGERFSFR